MENEKSEYDEQAEKFLKETGTEFKAEFLKYDKHFEDDKEPRDIYIITLKRGNREYKFNFGQSLYASQKWILWLDEKRTTNSDIEAKKYPAGKRQLNKDFKEPSAYDVLTCLQKSEPDDFKNFCADFGYNDDSIKAEKIYKAVCEEFKNLKMLYSDAELEQLQEIQ